MQLAPFRIIVLVICTIRNIFRKIAFVGVFEVLGGVANKLKLLLNCFYFAADIITAVSRREMRSGGHVPCVRREEKCVQCCGGEV
jgi:hypothetical protein